LIEIAALLLGGLIGTALVLHLISRVISAGALTKLGVPSAAAVKDLFWLETYEWEDAQAEDEETWQAERDKERVLKAITLNEHGEVGQAFELWLRLAEAGSVWSMGQVACWYEFGTGVSPDLAKAEEWYRRAAVGGLRLATLRYAALVRGRRDYARVEAIFSSDFFRDWPPAWFWLAYSRLRQSNRRADYMRALPLLERASMSGCPIAKLLLAQWMTWGRFGIRNIPRGLRLKWEYSEVAYGIVSEADPSSFMARIRRRPTLDHQTPA
jgi:TPR repeat protein